ncbi:MAG: nucleotide exchange factor GrpE, partial [Eubacteriales bacterium]
MSKKKNAAPEAEETKEKVPAEEKPEAENAEPAPEAEQEDPARKALDEANARADEYLALAQRVQADFENFRRRNESVRTDAYADGRKDTAALMLPVLDNLERAVEAAAGSPDEALRNGVEMVLKQMTDAYGKLEVKPINRLGEKF